MGLCTHEKGRGRGGYVYVYTEALWSICIINRLAFEKQNVSTNNLGHQTTVGHFFSSCVIGS